MKEIFPKWFFPSSTHSLYIFLNKTLHNTLHLTDNTYTYHLLQEQQSFRKGGGVASIMVAYTRVKLSSSAKVT